MRHTRPILPQPTPRPPGSIHRRPPACAIGHTGAVRVLAAPDKFRGTATAAEVAGAIGAAAVEAGWECDRAPIADGGEGLLDCFGGPNRESVVTGPGGTPLAAAWRLAGDLAVIETARASGLVVAGPDHDPVVATTRGTGELVAAALDAGARRVIVGAGGSATTDGGLGAVEVLRPYAPLDGSRGPVVEVAADVTTGFLDAAAVFAPQKGANAAQVALLAERLVSLAARYARDFGPDVTGLAGSGAAGGLAGGLAALGAHICSGFDLVAGELQLADRVRDVDLVLTGEGRLDATSAVGKAVGRLVELAREAGRPYRVLAGQVDPLAPPEISRYTLDLSLRFGLEAARRRPLACVRSAARQVLVAHHAESP